MDDTDLEDFKRAIDRLNFTHKTFLSRKEIDRLVEELNLNRDYKLADYISALGPAEVTELLR